MALITFGYATKSMLEISQPLFIEYRLLACHASFLTMKTFSISASKIATVCGKNFHEGEEMFTMVERIWEQIDPESYASAFGTQVELRRSPSSIPIPENIKQMCVDVHKKLESEPKETYLKSLIQQREHLRGKIEASMKNKNADEKAAMISFVRSNMNGSYGMKAEDKILDMFETLTSVGIKRHPGKKKRTFYFTLGGETIAMNVFGTPDGHIINGKDSLRIIECKAKMGAGQPDKCSIKDYLQAICYQILYCSDEKSQETLLLSHHELAKRSEDSRQLRLEDRTLSKWFMEDMMDTNEVVVSQTNTLDTVIVESIDSQLVEMPCKQQAGLLRILHICSEDAETVWSKVIHRIWMLLTVVMTLAKNVNWQQEWFAARDKSAWLEDALNYFPQFYSMDGFVHA